MVLGVMLVLSSWLVTARAQPAAPEIRGMQVERADDGLLLSANLQFELPLQIDDALRQGIPIHFVAEALVEKERWYWSDQVLASTSRYYRLSHQPLTRRWRLHVSSTPFSSVGTGLSLGQSFEHLGDALAVIQRIYRWKIMEEPPSSLSGATVQLRFKVDLTQLPRPLQIGVLGRSGWNLQMTRSHTMEASP